MDKLQAELANALLRHRNSYKISAAGTQWSRTSRIDQQNGVSQSRVSKRYTARLKRREPYIRTGSEPEFLAQLGYFSSTKTSTIKPSVEQYSIRDPLKALARRRRQRRHIVQLSRKKRFVPIERPIRTVFNPIERPVRAVTRCRKARVRSSRSRYQKRYWINRLRKSWRLRVFIASVVPSPILTRHHLLLPFPLTDSEVSGTTPQPFSEIDLALRIQALPQELQDQICELAVDLPSHTEILIGPGVTSRPWQLQLNRYLRMRLAKRYYSTNAFRLDYRPHIRTRWTYVYGWLHSLHPDHRSHIRDLRCWLPWGHSFFWGQLGHNPLRRPRFVKNCLIKHSCKYLPISEHCVVRASIPMQEDCAGPFWWITEAQLEENFDTNFR